MVKIFYNHFNLETVSIFLIVIDTCQLPWSVTSFFPLFTLVKLYSVPRHTWVRLSVSSGGPVEGSYRWWTPRGPELFTHFQCQLSAATTTCVVSGSCSSFDFQVVEISSFSSPSSPLGSCTQDPKSVRKFGTVLTWETYCVTRRGTDESSSVPSNILATRRRAT